MADTERLRPKGVPFSGSRYIKGQGFHKLRYIKEQGNRSFGYLKGPLITYIHRSDRCILYFIWCLIHSTSTLFQINLQVYKFLISNLEGSGSFFCLISQQLCICFATYFCKSTLLGGLIKEDLIMIFRIDAPCGCFSLFIKHYMKMRTRLPKVGIVPWALSH